MSSTSLGEIVHAAGLLKAHRGLAAVGERQPSPGQVQDEGDRRVGAARMVAEQAAQAVDAELAEGAGIGERGAVVQPAEQQPAVRAVLVEGEGDLGDPRRQRVVVDPLAVVEALWPTSPSGSRASR